MKYWLFRLGLALAAIFAPIQGMLMACLCLVAFDLITGIAAAHKRKEQIKSAGLKQTVLKLFIYELVIAFSFIAQHYLMSDALPIVNIVTGYIGVTEFLSIVENLNSVSGNNLLKALLERLSQTKQ